MLRAAEQWLASRSVDAPKQAAEHLLARVLRCDRLRLYLAHDRPLQEDERLAMRRGMERVGAGEPLAYVLGDQPFRDLVLEVSPAVLIPRPETEILVDLALARLPEGGTFVDLGTGSGAIALSIAAERPDVRGIAVDVSPEALAVARRNAERAGVTDRVTFVEGDWWAAVPEDQAFDLVVSNPPYVDPARPELLGRTVAEAEPGLALFTPEGDPGACYRAIAAGLGRFLRPGGAVALETGVGADAAAVEALRAVPELAVELEHDPAGHPRFVLASFALGQHAG